MIKQIYFILAFFFLFTGLSLHYFIDCIYVLLHFFNSNFYNPDFFKYFTEIGNGFIAAAFVIPILSLISDKYKAFNFVPLSALIFPTIYMGLINSFLKKEFFAFERPGFYEFENIEYLEPVFKYDSFPSGHAATIFIIVFIWLGLAVKKGFKYKPHLYSILIALAGSVAISRVIIGAHWMSDILASIGIAFLFRAFVDLKFFYNHITQSKVLKYLSYVVVLTAWVNILFFDISDYF